MITIFQIVVILFSFFALSRAVFRFKGKQITFGMMLLWSFVWCGVILTAFFPRIVEPFAVFFGTRAADLVIFAGLIGCYYLMFRLYVKIEDVQHDLALLVRKIALEQEKRKKEG